MARSLDIALFIQYVNIEIKIEGFNAWQRAFQKCRERLDLDVCAQLLALARQLDDIPVEWLDFHDAEFAFDNLNNAQAKTRFNLLLEQTIPSLLRANTLKKIADIERVMAKYDSAIYYYNLALEEFSKTDDELTPLSILHMLGVTYWAKGSYENKSFFDEATSYYNSSLEGYRKLFNNWKQAPYYNSIITNEVSIQKQIANVLRDLGDIYRKVGELDLAESHLEESVSILREQKSLYETQMTLISLAKLYKEQRNWQKCIQTNIEALEMAQKIGAINYEIETLTRLADAFYTMGKYSDAEKWAYKAMAASETYGLLYWCARSNAIIGLILIAAGKVSEGVDALIRCIDFANKFNPDLKNNVVKQEILYVIKSIQGSSPEQAKRLSYALS